ncbi:hypothetical protein EOW65_09090 [Sinirhodobacter ferrireducens]|uniref:Uncharacterized protein n=1 Tax=Paenirhodobacter ferrireducens TaxID=1215032 RepID=A0A443LJY5_9RHOB|nr:hypothetical protein [Sinirhodobacter ferrireducens]RWR49423.1 hypothetical protein EOW65_09090 [Sinirhodobacter ferrireducens]
MEQPHHPAHVSLAPLPEALRPRHNDPRAETAPPRDVISPPRRPRRRAPVLIVALRELLAEERQ